MAKFLFKKGHIVSEETRRRISIANTGKKRTKEMNMASSLRTKGRIGTRLGSKASPETIEKLRISHTGKKQSRETCEKRNKKISGKNCYMWKGGISKIKGYASFISRKREIRKRNNGGNHTMAEWELLKKQYNNTCPCCHKSEPFIGQRHLYLTEDHIIPLIKGGSDNIENIQPLCGNCNNKKRTNIIKYE